MNALKWFYNYQIFCARVNDFKVIFVIEILLYIFNYFFRNLDSYKCTYFVKIFYNMGSIIKDILICN